MKYGTVGYAVFAAIFGASGLASAADTVNESEPNDPIASAQQLVITSGSITVNAVLRNTNDPTKGEADFYTFYGQEGDLLTVDIDGAYDPTNSSDSFDSFIAVMGPAPSNSVLRANANAAAVDTGSASVLDSYIDKFKLPATGYYTVGVTHAGKYFKDGVLMGNGGSQNGDYKLIISGTTSPVLQIAIDIKPGSGDIAPVNPKSRGKIPVALLSSSEFNALSVDTGSLRFGSTGDEKSLSHCGSNSEDVNNDGRLDLVCHFQNQLVGFKEGDIEGVVRGKTTSGRMFEGRGWLKVVP